MKLHQLVENPQPQEEILPGINPNPPNFSTDCTTPVICKHGFDATVCGICDRIAAFKELEPHATAYREALQRHNAPKGKKKPSQVDVADVWPQHYDFTLVSDYEGRLTAIESKYCIAEVRFKRILRLSNGVTIPRGCIGVLLDDDCLTDVLKCIPVNRLKCSYLDLLQKAKENDSHWISVNKFLILIPQIMITEKMRRKDKTLQTEKKINYEILTTQKDLFR